ncbi:MAG: hypothetical protein ACRDNM_00155 [Gaiellaceae bacterium]
MAWSTATKWAIGGAAALVGVAIAAIAANASAPPAAPPPAGGSTYHLISGERYRVTITGSNGLPPVSATAMQAVLDAGAPGAFRIVSATPGATNPNSIAFTIDTLASYAMPDATFKSPFQGSGTPATITVIVDDLGPSPVGAMRPPTTTPPTTSPTTTPPTTTPPAGTPPPATPPAGSGPPNQGGPSGGGPFGGYGPPLPPAQGPTSVDYQTATNRSLLAGGLSSWVSVS